MNYLKAMRLFVLSVRGGSLAAAAAEEGISATMVANHLRSLEEHLGMTLINRTTRRQSLSEFGTLYLERCIDILERIDAADMLALDAQAEPTGRLRITAPIVFGIDELMPALADYAAKYPKVRLDVSINDGLTDLITDGFEAAIRIGALKDSDLIARPLRPVKLVCCASPKYLSSRGKPQRLTDLINHECLDYVHTVQSEWRFSGRFWPMRDNGNPVTVPIGGNHNVDNAPALRRMALSGMGIVLLPLAVMKDDIDSGCVVPILVEHTPIDRPLHLVYQRDVHVSPKLKSFIDFVLYRFGLHRTK